MFARKATRTGVQLPSPPLSGRSGLPNTPVAPTAHNVPFGVTAIPCRRFFRAGRPGNKSVTKVQLRRTGRTCLLLLQPKLKKSGTDMKPAKLIRAAKDFFGIRRVV